MFFKPVTFSMFCDAFERHGRAGSFTYAGKRTLYDYFEDFEENVEMDIIAICCEYSESDWEVVAKDYNIDLSECEDEDEKIKSVCEYLSENTTLIGTSTSEGTFVYVDF